MRCPHCGAAVGGDRKFCGDCGTALPWPCNACGSENPADKRFCGDCGAARGAVSDAPAVPAAASMPERRLMTVMFIDLVGSTALGERLDPEDLRKVITDFHDLTSGLITSFNGFVARYMGDGALVYFGYPQAHETDAERAVRAGLAIVDAVSRLNTLAGPPGTLSVRVGIDSGLVVVGDQIGFGSSREAAVVGDVPNLAARLQTAADPGAVVISEATRLLVGNLFEYRAVELHNLKGRRDVERARVVLRESAIESRYEALRSGHLPLVGRIEELDLLLRRWDQAKAGEGRVILLSGEAGIGKSRLIAALEQRVGTLAGPPLHYICSPHHLDTPLYPVIRQIERSAGFQRGEPPPSKWTKLANSFAGASPEDQAVLADLLSVPCPASDGLKDVPPQRRKAMTFAAIIRHIDDVAAQLPLLCLLEDMHWADPTTAELIDLLIESIKQLPVLLVVTARPEIRPAWAARPHVTVQPLSGLDNRHAAALIKQVAGGRDLPSDVIDRIIAHADCVPLFIEELTNTVLQKKRADPGNNTEPSSPQSLLSADMVPRSLHSSLMARLDQLPTGKEVAQIGAVIGREFSFEMMQALTRLPARRLELALAELLQAGIIVSYGTSPSATYTFKHALVQDAAYASLLRERRRAIHLRIAEELEQDQAEEPAEPHLIAWHFAEAGAADKSIHYYRQAAIRATGRSALAEMVSHLRNALAQIAQLPESPDRYRQELNLQLKLGSALIDHRGSGSEEVRATFERARELCLALDEVNLLPRVYDGLVLNYHFTHSEPQKIVRYTGEIINVCERTNDAQALLMARRAGALANLLLGRFEAAREDMQRIVDMYQLDRDGPHAGMSTRDPKVSTCTLLGICLTILGFPDTGAAASLAGVDHAKTLNHPISLNLGLRRACVQGMLLRDSGRVLTLSQELATLREAYETYKGSWEGTLFHDWAQNHERPVAAHLEGMLALLRRLDGTKNWALLPFYMTCAAELKGLSGDAASATALLQRASELSSATGSQWCDAEILRLKGCFTPDRDEASRLFRASLKTAREQGARLWELRTAVNLAELLRDQGDCAGARDVLKPSYDWFIEGWSTEDLTTARSLLKELE
ncbi:MAG: AAA family ATPase [Rhizobiales bacterium]|nr:AAA family ATPase [Hyphomicrobiales bacterium]